MTFRLRVPRPSHTQSNEGLCIKKWWDRLKGHAKSRVVLLTRHASAAVVLNRLCCQIHFVVAHDQSGRYLRLFPHLGLACSVVDANAGVCGRTMPLVRTNIVASYPCRCGGGFRGARLAPSLPSHRALNCLQSVFPSLLTTNSSINSSVCFPTLAASISPLLTAKLTPIQQSPTFNSPGTHCFCFFLH